MGATIARAFVATRTVWRTYNKSLRTEGYAKGMARMGFLLCQESTRLWEHLLSLRDQRVGERSLRQAIAAASDRLAELVEERGRVAYRGEPDFARLQVRRLLEEVLLQPTKPERRATLLAGAVIPFSVLLVMVAFSGGWNAPIGDPGLLVFLCFMVGILSTISLIMSLSSDAINYIRRRLLGRQRAEHARHERRALQTTSPTPASEDLSGFEDIPSSTIAAHRSLIQSLGPEIGPEACARGGCARKRISHSVMCRRHHFEMLSEVSARRASAREEASSAHAGATVTIERPCDLVWSVFTDTNNWANWWGGSVRAVTPEWREGAHIEWQAGPPSEVFLFVPQTRVGLKGRFGERLTWTFTSVGSGGTRVAAEWDLSGSSLGLRDVAGQEAELREQLSKLRRLVESVSAGRGKPTPSAEEEADALVRSGLLSRFVREKNGSWNHQDWLDFLARVRDAGYRSLPADNVGRLLEEERARQAKAAHKTARTEEPSAVSAARKAGELLKNGRAQLEETLGPRSVSVLELQSAIFQYLEAMVSLDRGSITPDQFRSRGKPLWQAIERLVNEMGDSYISSEWSSYKAGRVPESLQHLENIATALRTM